MTDSVQVTGTGDWELGVNTSSEPENRMRKQRAVRQMGGSWEAQVLSPGHPCA